jgi:hypothetical protein
MNIGEGIGLVAVRSAQETRRKKPCTFLSQTNYLRNNVGAQLLRRKKSRKAPRSHCRREDPSLM